MINVSTPQKDVVLSFFKNDIQLVKKHFMMISFDFDESFEYTTFKDFIFSAAGMMKDLDQAIYNAELLSSFNTIECLDKAHSAFVSKSSHSLQVYQKEFLFAQEEYVVQQKKYDDLQAELQLLISKEQLLNARLKLENTKIAKLKEEGTLDSLSQEQVNDIKALRREHVDTVHYLGQRRDEIEEVQNLLSTFEHEQKAIFMDFFTSVKEKLDYQYSQSLNFFGFEFNEKLFIDSEKSASVQKFKKEANIKGDLNLCKYVEYYLKNVNPDALANKDKKQKLHAAKEYCEKLNKSNEAF